MKNWSHLPLFSHGPGTPLAYLGHGIAGARASHRQFEGGGGREYIPRWHLGICARTAGPRRGVATYVVGRTAPQKEPSHK